MRNLVKLSTLALWIVAIGFLPAAAEEGSLALVHPGVDGVTPPEAKARWSMAPYYPATAKAANAMGSVIVAATVLRNGSVGDVEVVACDYPDVGFEASALDAVKEWRFKPATKDGAAVDSYALVHLQFAPPSGRLGAGAVSMNTFVRQDLPTGLPGAPAPVSLPGGNSLAAAGDSSRPVPETHLRIPCGPRDPGRCLYDRDELREQAKKRRGEPGVNRPLGGKN